MKRIVFSIILIIALLAFGSPAWSGNERLQAEPAMMTQAGWNLEPSGMLTVGYDLNGNGRPDFFTVRVVLDKYISDQPIETVARYNPGLPVFRADYGEDGFYYIAERYPLFYAVDVNEDGDWDVLYKDALVDGVNGNEEFYDNPSGWSGAVPGGEPPLVILDNRWRK